VTVPLALVFAPYVVRDGALVSPHYDLPEYRAEIAGWMRELRYDWEWVVVTRETFAEVLERTDRLAGHRRLLVVNLCDGTLVDGYPGVEVVEALAERGLAYTGADEAFYRITTSKAASKERLKAAGVPTAPYVMLIDEERDITRAVREIGWPLFIKPDVSAGSYGIQVDSVTYDLDSARRKIAQLHAGMHGQNFTEGAVLAEAFLAGREFTVLVAEDDRSPHGLYVLPPGERVFDPRIPSNERFLAFERYWGLPEEERPIPSDEPYYWYASVSDDVRLRLEDVARRAFRAVGGRSYARIDIREDPATGAFMVLEVNAQCGLSSDDSSTVGSMLNLAGVSMIEVVRRIFETALADQAPNTVRRRKQG
jgi:D-alanine-D-alanine ligase